ncbi:MAG: HIT family protein [Thermoplasmatota archaeon]
MGDCLFCRIAGGLLPAAEVYQDDRVFAFLDIHPLSPGHTLLVPKRHAARLEEADPEDAAALMRAAQHILRGLAAVTGSPDATVAVNNGPAAGQEVGHLHFHLVPRKAGDGGHPVHAIMGGSIAMGSDDLHDLAIRLARRLEVPSW